MWYVFHFMKIYPPVSVQNEEEIIRWWKWEKVYFVSEFPQKIVCLCCIGCYLY